MDKLMEQLGTYDLFSYLLSGMAVIAAGYIADFHLFFTGNAQGDGVLAALFFVESYIYGMVVHEVSSCLDRLFQLGYAPKEIYLDNMSTIRYRSFYTKRKLYRQVIRCFIRKKPGKVKRYLFIRKRMLFLRSLINHINVFMPAKTVVSGRDRNEYRKYAADILELPGKTVFTSDEQRQVYEVCKRDLEIAGKDKEVQAMEAMYALTRNILTILLFSLLLLIYRIEKSLWLHEFQKDGPGLLIRVVGIVFLLFLFDFRADRFARYRVGEVMSHYRAMKKEEQKEKSS